MPSPLWSYLWASPNSALGLLIALLARVTGGGLEVHSGVLEAWGGFPEWWLRKLTPLSGGAAAITFGHVVIGQSPRDLERTRVHERVHVQQYARFGIFFLPAYLLSSLIAAMRGGDAYRDNLFEREAYRVEREFRAVDQDGLAQATASKIESEAARD